MNFIGNYSNGRAMVNVSCKGTDAVSVRITWGSSAFYSSTWTMSGSAKMVGDCLIVNYTNCTKETVAYNTDGTLNVDAVEYTNGSGALTFHGSSLLWDDYQEDAADGQVFSYIY